MCCHKLSALLLLSLSAVGAAVAASLWARRKNTRKGPLAGEAELGADVAQQDVERVELENLVCSSLPVNIETESLEAGSLAPKVTESEHETENLCPGEGSLDFQEGYSEEGALNRKPESQNIGGDNMEEGDEGKQHGISLLEQPDGKPGPELTVGAAVAASLWARRKNTRKGPLAGEAELGADVAQQDVERVEPEKLGCSSLPVIIETENLQAESLAPEVRESEHETENLCPGEGSLDFQEGYSEQGALNRKPESQNIGGDNMEEGDEGKQHGISLLEQPDGEPGPELAVGNFPSEVAAPAMKQVFKNGDTWDENMINESKDEGIIAEEEVNNERKDNVIVGEEKVGLKRGDQGMSSEEQVQNDEQSPECGSDDTTKVGDRRAPLSGRLQSVGKFLGVKKRRYAEVRLAEDGKTEYKRRWPRTNQKLHRDRQRCEQEGCRGEGMVPADMTLQSRFCKEDSVHITKYTEDLNANSHKEAEEDFNEEDLEVMLKGSRLLKIKSHFWMKFRYYRLQEDCQMVWYDSQKIFKRARNQIFSIADIQEVRAGHWSEVILEKCTDCSFSILFKERNTKLDLVANSTEEAQHWVNGLTKLKIRNSSMKRRGQLDQLFQLYLQKANIDKNAKITLEEVKQFMHMMNIEVDSMHAMDLFKKCDKAKDGTICGREIKEFYHMLTDRKEITTIFDFYCNKEQLISVGKLQEFLWKEQRESVTQESASHLIQMYELNEEAKRHFFMTKDGFLFFLMSPRGDIFNQEHDKVYQNMTKPLDQYYISSSHNTYLLRNPLDGSSITETFISELNKGCRWMEMECWNGRNGEPVTYHGFALTSEVLLRDVMEVINNYAFTVTPYPFILLLRSHCSLEQEKVMVQVMESILGDKLLYKPFIGTMPSPEELKGKILVKLKRVNRVIGAIVENEEALDEDEAAEMEEVARKQKSQEKDAKLNRVKELPGVLIYCKIIHFNRFEGAMSNQVFYETLSFVANKFSDLVQNSGSTFHYDAQQLDRIYPEDGRTDSSNYSAIDMWNAGYQIVALNFQTFGQEMDIYQSKFRNNGFSGYILKPKFLRKRKTTCAPRIQMRPWLNRKKLSVLVISAQQLPKTNKAKPGSVVDPLVKVQVFGVKDDNDQKVTPHVSNNGFNPMWNICFQFDVCVPELAFVRFLVQDYNDSSRNDFIGQFTLPFTSLQQGYRHIHLLSANGDPLPAASLFVNIRID
ncbi:1-phosphatidylinositol 4,5-bisphosphate phosphodiesterase delta-1-like [Mobula birostris]|uniref:1-phosphatidylinositol 4,5-bisphosphate phosphodiesterase delta-1-like n=1 Tax=Mobula birostris TaxID=1983395 RepID=UPI003B2839C2